MNDFFELEKKCKKIKRKKFIKIFLSFLSMIFILIGGIFIYNYLNKPEPKAQIKKTQPQPKVIKPIQKPKPKKVIKKEIKTEIKEKPLDIEIDLNNIKQPIIKQKKTKPIQKPKPKKVIKKEPKPKKILQEETVSFEKAIKLATLYYNNGNYQNSIKWCKIASKLDNTNEKVWKLYALNLEKIGQKKKAIKVIKTYLQYRDSLDLKYLLERLEK